MAWLVSNVFNIQKEQMNIWTDSMNVLWWIRRHSRDFKPFVSNRVGEIQMSTYPAQWKHVSTKLNPADYLTRGVKLLQLAELDVWWEGPHFLHNDEKVWPKCVIEQNPVEATEGDKRSVLVSSDIRRLHSCNCVTMVSSSLT